MRVFKLIFKNLFRHKLRSALTILGIAVAVMAYGLMRTVIDAWYIGIEASAPDRLVTRHAVSFIFELPVSYKERIASVQGVKSVSYATWFQGVYIDENNFFARMAVEAETAFDMYPEFLLSEEEMNDFKRQRNSCVIGIKTSKKYNLEIGDMITIEGDIYPGTWDFEVRGIYRGAKPSTDETQMFFHWRYLDERMRKEAPERAGNVGWFSIRIDDPSNAAPVSVAVDELFRNSRAETITETEEAFVQGFISMSSAILASIEFISFVIIGIILLVLANTMVMTARERIVEYAVLKTLGFTGFHISGLILGESLAIACTGGVVGLFLTFPVTQGMAIQMSSFFPIFTIGTDTLVTAMLFAILVGIVAAIVPIYRATQTSIVEGLRHIG